MTPFEELSVIFSGVTTVVAVAGLAYAGRQLHQAKITLMSMYKIHAAEHDWNRRVAAQNALKEYNQTVVRSGLHLEFDYFNRKEPIPLIEIESKFASNRLLQDELHQLLNYYESLARGVFQQIYDEDVIKSGRRRAMTKALRAFFSYIEDRRAKLSPSAWTDLESLVSKWVHEENMKAPRPAAIAEP